MRGKSVVIYSHEPTRAGDVRDALTDEGFRVEVSASFAEVVGWLMLDGDTALVLDIPPMDSFRVSVLREARRIGPAVPIVALVQSITPAVKRDVQRAGVAEVVLWVDDSSHIVAAVRAALANPPGSRQEQEAK